MRSLPLFLLMGAAILGWTAGPDYSLPPGAINPQVTQANTSTTICLDGWIRTVRPTAEYMSALKRRQMADRHLPGKPGDYQVDHLIPFELGGHPTDPRNLWPHPIAQAERKNEVEFGLNRAVCAHRMPLVEAQRLIRDPRNR